jgi:hypothetical protein
MGELRLNVLRSRSSWYTSLVTSGKCEFEKEKEDEVVVETLSAVGRVGKGVVATVVAVTACGRGFGGGGGFGEGLPKGLGVATITALDLFTATALGLDTISLTVLATTVTLAGALCSVSELLEEPELTWILRLDDDDEYSELLLLLLSSPSLSRSLEVPRLLCLLSLSDLLSLPPATFFAAETTTSFFRLGTADVRRFCLTAVI